jgi:zinc transporter, ZIP family
MAYHHRRGRGALVFFFADRAVEQWAIRTGGMAGLSLALGGLLDGIPEQAVLGIGCPTGRACPSPC